MKKELKNIKSLINQDSKYQNVEKKLDFSDFNNVPVQKAKQNNWLKVFIPVTAICLTVIIASGIVVPNLLSNKQSRMNNLPISSSQQTTPNKQVVMEPVSEKTMSFYLNNTQFGSDNPAEPTTVWTLYNRFKQYPEEWHLFQENKEIYDLVAESKIHFYYVTKEVYDAVDQVLKTVSVYDSALPWRGLTAYIYARNNGNGSTFLSEELANQPIMEVVLNDEIDCIEKVANGYYLLDIIRYYNDLDYENFYYIDFIPYQIINNQITIKTSELRMTFKGFDCTWHNREIRSSKAGCCYFSSIKSLCSEIILKNNVETVEERFKYINLTDDPQFYDDLDKCIIEKTSIDSNTYNIIFDYQKLVFLLNL